VRRKGDMLGAAAIAKINTQLSLTDPRVLPLAAALGITFNISNNVESNNTETRLAALEATIVTQAQEIADLQSRVTTLESA
jgi:hypothetical protein